MASVKRKAVTDDRPSKKPKAEHVDRKEKKPPKTFTTTEAGERRPVPKSILQQEERAFPRGGGSVLTPLEHRQIKVKAEQDALFEEQTGERAPRADGEDNEDLFDEPASNARPSKKKNLRKDNKDPKKGAGGGLVARGLSYKTLVPGSVVLGCVTAITGRDVSLALPNNLTGYVPITSISDSLNTKIEQLLDQEEDEDQEDDGEDVELNKYFYLGQWLRAIVTASGSDPADGGKSKRHIELSIKPNVVNKGLTVDNIVVHSMVQASVRSVEDHGVLVDLGLPDDNIKGFISKKELGASHGLDELRQGQVLMCLVTGKGSNGKVLKLSPDAARFSSLGTDKNSPLVSEAPSIDAFLPGTAVNVLVTETAGSGIAGKIMGMQDVTADLVHADAATGEIDLSKKHKIGSHVKGRITFSIPRDDNTRRVGISLSGHLLALPPPSSKLPQVATPKQRAQSSELEDLLAISSTIEDAKVTRVLPGRGLYLSLPSTSGKDRLAFAHISQLSDNRIDTISSSSGPYKLESTHRVRIIAFNPVDNVYYVALKKSVLEQSFLRLEDLEIGSVVSGTVDRMILGGKSGITGIIVKLSDSINSLVPSMHFSDVQLQHPERKFREGLTVKAKILSVDLEKRQVRLTLKKSLVNADDENVWKAYSDLEPGMESEGTVVSLHPKGAAVQYFGGVRAWLPVSEMSDTFIERPESHFRLGQTVKTRIVSVDASSEQMKVSCKDPSSLDEAQQESWMGMDYGDVIDGTVTVKNNDSVSIELANGNNGLIRVGQLADGAPSKAENVLKRLRVGQKVPDLVILDKLERSKIVVLSNKESLRKAVEVAALLRTFDDVQEGLTVHGFVRNVTPEGIYVEYANGMVGLVPRSQVPPEMVSKPAFGLVKDSTVHAWILSVDSARERFVLSMREQKIVPPDAKQVREPVHAVHAVDPSISSADDISVGKVTKVRIASVKGTQINVRLADNLQGRIDVSEVFDSFDEFANSKNPLQKFSPNEILDVKVLGVHDARSHRFLPITHRGKTNPIYELSAKRSRVEGGSKELLDFVSVQIGSEYMAFVNNYSDDCVWVNLSPNVRGRIGLMDLSDDAGALQQLERHFPIGAAIRVKAKKVDPNAGRLDLTARIGTGNAALTIKDISPGMIVPARVTKITERSINVQLSDTLAGPVPLVEISDDYDDINLEQFNKNDIVRVCVLDTDVPNKKLFLSLRPSKTLSSSLPVKDIHISNMKQLKQGDIVRGFTKHVTEKGVIVSLSAKVDAFVRVSDLSDRFVKDWKTIVEIDTLVKGRILSVDEESKHIALSLKASHVDKNYKPPLTIDDLKTGMIVTGKVRKVEDFGAFIDLDNTQPRLSGLCHRSEVAAKRVEDVRKLYNSGDVVKVKILNVDVGARKISLGLKASYFADEMDVDEDAASSADEGVELDAELDDEDVDMDGGINLHDVEDMESEDEGSEAVESDGEDGEAQTATTGLQTSGFDWTGEANPVQTNEASDSEPDTTSKKKKKKKAKSTIKTDMTGDLDAFGPRSTSDFERLLLGLPNDSSLWMQYMAFQLELGELEAARTLAARALRTIHIRETDAKLNIWIAWLNLEVEYGDADHVEDIFKQACAVQDPLVMHEKLASIYIDSGRHQLADDIFERMVANKTFRAVGDVWLNYAHFLMEKMKEPVRARALLTRALKSVPSHEHRLLSAKFAALEFRCAAGDAERGRTIFEGIMAEWPKWASGWDMWIDMERGRIEGDAEAKGKVRDLFERISNGKMKKRRAKYLFKRWLEFEEAEGDAKSVERVKARAKEFVESMQSKGGAEDEEMED